MYKNAVTSMQRKRQLQQYQRFQERFNTDENFTQAAKRFLDPNDLYAYMHHYFYHFCAPQIRKHRDYFSVEQRGYGEAAFHAMWCLLLREYRPVRCLEIGVYRGQVITLWALIAELLHQKIEVHGISPFTSAGDSVSVYLQNIDYLTDVHKSFEYFHLQQPTLVKAFSNDETGRKHIASQGWDLVYIDGSHDCDVVLSDYRLSLEHLAPKGLIVFDDSSLYTTYSPAFFATAGHPGPSQVVRDYVMKEMNLVGAVGHNSVFQKRS